MNDGQFSVLRLGNDLVKHKISEKCSTNDQLSSRSSAENLGTGENHVKLDKVLTESRVKRGDTCFLLLM